MKRKAVGRNIRKKKRGMWQAYMTLCFNSVWMTPFEVMQLFIRTQGELNYVVWWGPKMTLAFTLSKMKIQEGSGVEEYTHRIS